MAPIAYAVTVPLFIRQLESLRSLLKKGSEWCKTNGYPDSKLTESRLVPDMLPFTFQVQACCNSPVRLLNRLADIEVPSIPDEEKTFAELDARIVRTIEILKTAKPEAFEGKETKEIVFQGKSADMLFDGMGYAQEFGIPNFFFHKTAAYALLRLAGVEVGKLDFLGTPSKGSVPKQQ